MNPTNLIINIPTLTSYREDGGEFTQEQPSVGSYSVFSLEFKFPRPTNSTEWISRFFEFAWGPADLVNRAEVIFTVNESNEIVDCSFRDLLGYGLELDLEDLIEIFPRLADFNKLLKEASNA
jgi:hypothetical protein